MATRTGTIEPAGIGGIFRRIWDTIAQIVMAIFRF